MACNSNFSKEEREKVAKYLRYQMVEAQVRYYKWCYFELERHEMNDVQFDWLEKQFNALAHELGLPGSWNDSRDELVDESMYLPNYLKKEIQFITEGQ